MSQSRGAAASISIRFELNSVHTEFSIGGEPPVPIPTREGFGQSGLRDLREVIREELKEIKATIGLALNRRDDWGKISPAVQQLHGLGKLLANELFGPER